MVELLAPAGSIEALKMAVYNSADAVYLGLERFNARNKAENFSTQNLVFWVEFCHLYGVKVYVTLNISIKQGELNDLEESILACSNANVDALIISDLAVMAIVKKLKINIPLHASTQLGIHNLYGAKFAERLGFSRVVLSREATLEEIKLIKCNTKLEVEYFVHGALCVSFSGDCLFSSLSTGNSGNRGECLQPCRKMYSETLTGSSGFLLSTKDQCLIAKLEELTSAGVDSFKIEGRMKSAEYVSETVAMYKKAMQKIKITSNDFNDLKKVYNRGGFTLGYSYNKGSQLMYSKINGHLGVDIGEVIACGKTNYGYLIKVKAQEKIFNGDGFKVIYNNVEVGGFLANNIKMEGDYYIIETSVSFPINAKVHKTLDAVLKNKLLSVKKFLNTDIKIIAKIGSPLKVILCCCGIECEYVGDYNVESAINAPLTKESLVINFCKTGDTHFKIVNIECEMGGDIFLPKSEINKARREALNILKKKIIDTHTIKHKIALCNKNISSIDYTANKFIVEFDSIDFADNLGSSKIDIVWNPFNDFDAESINYNDIAIKINLIENNIFIKLPKIALSNDLIFIEELLKSLPEKIGIFAENIYALELAIKYNKKVLGSYSLNIFNLLHANELALNNYCVSSELNQKELKGFQGKILYAFGNLPVMTLAHCPIMCYTKNDCCNCKYRPFKLYDKYGEYFINRIKVANCSFVVKNNAKHNLSGELEKLKGYNLYLDLTQENESDVKYILTAFLNGEKYDCKDKQTLGHLYRGVK